MKHTLIRTVPDESAQAFAGCGHGPQPAARRAAGAPPVFVNGVAIPESAIAQEAQNHSAGSGAEARAAAARALAIRELLLQRARVLGLAPAPRKDAQGRLETEDDALVRQVLELEAAAAEPSEAECRRAYAAAADRFRAPELYAASHILFADEDEDRAYERALAAVAALNGGADFAALARAHSACPTASEGGALGQLQRGDLSRELEQALLALQPGQVGPEPVRTRFGWHVVRLDAHAPSHRLPFEAVEARIRSALRERAWPAAAAKYVERLAHAAEIEGLNLGFGSGGGA